MKRIIPYGKQTIEKDDILSVRNTLESNFLTTGPVTKKFEQKFKQYVGSQFASSCSSGTSALHLSLLAIKVKKGDIIILPVINFIASVNMAQLVGAKIYFSDVDKLTGQMTPKNLVDCIKKNKLKKIKAVITMYNGGSPNNAKVFFQLKKKYKFTLIEDACHALGGKYDNKKNLKVGSCKFSDITTFSLHPIKSITTGEGGMITTNNKNYFKRISILKNHGIVKKNKRRNVNNWSYKVIAPGYNYRLSDIACSLGISQLKKIDKFIKKRNLIFNWYRKKLSKYSHYLILPNSKNNEISANHLFIILFKEKRIKISREKIIQKLYQKGIITQVHYIPVYYHPYYKNICKGSFEGANFYFNNCLSLPIFPSLKLSDLNNVVKILEKILIRNKNEI